jgi:hypothetical protein
MHRSNQHLHSITSSTRTNNVAGTSRSRALTVLRLIISSYPVAPKLAGRPAFPNDDAIDVACLVLALVNLSFGPRVNVVVPRQNSQGTVITILVHNRPSGDPNALARRYRNDEVIVEVAKPLGISVHDHIIVGKEGHASFKGLKLI